MASGYGINGGESRCFVFWQAVAKCYAESDRPGKCTLLKEDYNECLHHRKARAKQALVRKEFQRIRSEGREEIKRQSEIYKSMGRAGGIQIGLIEHILAKSSIAKYEGTSGPSLEEISDLIKNRNEELRSQGIEAASKFELPYPGFRTKGEGKK